MEVKTHEGFSIFMRSIVHIWNKNAYHDSCTENGLKMGLMELLKLVIYLVYCVQAKVVICEKKIYLQTSSDCTYSEMLSIKSKVPQP